MKRTIISVMFFALGVVFIAFGLMKNDVLQHEIVKNHQEAVTLTVEDVKVNEQVQGNFDFTQLEALSDEDVLNLAISGTRMKAVGLIAIPDISVRLPIGVGISFENMALGAGTLRENQVMGQGNYVLASHTLDNNQRPDLLFGSLHTMTQGQVIYITNMDKVYTYTVMESAEVEATRVDLVDDTDMNVITLITCTRNGEKRWYVRGKLTAVNDKKDATKAQVDAFGVQENAWYH